MKRLALIAPALLLAACATSPTGTASRAWLAGTWLMMEPGVEHPLACDSDRPIRYRADGSYAFADERGRWRLEGDRLTETLAEGGDPDEVGRPHVSRIVRTGADTFDKTYRDGGVATFRRCPAGP